MGQQFDQGGHDTWIADLTQGTRSRRLNWSGACFSKFDQWLQGDGNLQFPKCMRSGYYDHIIGIVE
ncbi:hypothetical protein CCAX7_60220 [Capsulimonas corticalis]|uniref:Uncharacterized protein n=1 Tax=Capsulimonas corticalis TaxID=2219043 RepID=A0A402CVY3_9BACT|nr:hypothetical protein CCAX7_60220 [Capsulimonas corticalis]